MHPRRAVALAIAFLPLVVTAPARAWQEVHELGQDFVVRVDAAGVASVEDKVRWRVVRGPLKSLDFGGLDVDNLRDPSVTVTAEDGRPLAAHFVRQDARTLRVVIDEPHAPAHGVFAFNWHWQTDLIGSHALVRDGASYRLAWSAPAAVDGFDGARTVFDVPAAADPPHAIVPETGLVDDGAVASLRRDPGRDVLELTRPHVAHGEPVTWTLRLDSRAFAPLAASPSVAEVAPTIPLEEEDRVHEACLLAGLFALACAFGGLVAAKAKAFAAASAARGARTRALLLLPDTLRAVFAGVGLAAGVALQAFGRPTLGGLCVALAALSAAQRPPASKPRVRGPGRWLVLRPSEAFEDSADRCHGSDPAKAAWLDALDVGTVPGRVALLAVTSVAIAVTVVLGRFAAEAAWIFAMDAGVLLPVWLTGSVVQLPPYGRGAVAPWLVRAFRRLRVAQGLRAAPWGRLALDGAIDEMRILVLPRACMPGVVGIEVGQAWCSTPVGWASVPELLVRVTDGSAAAAKLAQITSALKEGVFVGRKPDERVVRLVPRGPGASDAVALARAVASELTERRIAAMAGASSDTQAAPAAPSNVPPPGPRKPFHGEDRRGSSCVHPGFGPNVLEPRASAHGA